MAISYLQVEYREKDLVKSLGARWDGAAKRWFMPLDADPAVFARWLPSDAIDNPVAGGQLQSQPLQEGVTEISTLSQLLARVAQSVARVTPSVEWIKAEISEFRPTKQGHIHLDLVELDVHKNLLSKANAKLFKNQADVLLHKFSSATGSALSLGMKVLVAVRVQFHIQYGFALIIEDIDPTYTLGDIAAKLAAIRDTLSQEGVFERNRQLPPPREFCRVAVLSPQVAAGLGDFQQEADLLAKHHLCHFDYFHAQFQGERAGGEMAHALDAIIKVHAIQAFDAVVIIRGGGASIDLAWLNDLELARRICLAPVPVFSGIGHERDNTILDEVAQQRFDTPSKVINHIVNTIVRNAQQAALHMESIDKHMRHNVERLQQHSQHLYQQIQSDLRQALNISAQALQHHYQSLVTGARHHLSTLALALDHLHHQIVTLAQTHVRTLEQRLDDYHHSIPENVQQCCYYYEQELKKLLLHAVSLGPEATLQRGFALATSLDGRVIHSVVDAKQQQQWCLRFHDGALTVQPIKEVLA